MIHFASIVLNAVSMMLLPNDIFERLKKLKAHGKWLPMALTLEDRLLGLYTYNLP